MITEQDLERTEQELREELERRERFLQVGACSPKAVDEVRTALGTIAGQRAALARAAAARLADLCAAHARAAKRGAKRAQAAAEEALGHLQRFVDAMSDAQAGAQVVAEAEEALRALGAAPAVVLEHPFLAEHVLEAYNIVRLAACIGIYPKGPGTLEALTDAADGTIPE